jgi:hypothetical protein
VKRKLDQDAFDFVIQQVESQVLGNDIIVDLCEQFGMNWQEAEELVLDVEITHRGKVDPGQMPSLRIFGVGVLIFAAIYSLGKIIFAEGSITIQSLDLVILISVMSTLVMFLILFLHSGRQNSIKESFRCPKCGYLANYKGNENSILSPRYMESTYYSRRKKLKTWREEFVPLFQGIFPHDGSEWDEYSLFEITEFCRNCKQVRNEFRKVKKVDQFRHSNNIDYGPR